MYRIIVVIASAVQDAHVPQNDENRGPGLGAHVMLCLCFYYVIINACILSFQ